VAKAVGVRRATIRAWETGRTEPRGRRREVYAKVLGILWDGKPTEVSPRTSEPTSRTEHAPQAHPQAQAPAATPEKTAPPPAEPEPGPTPAPTPAEAFDALYSYIAPALIRQTYLLTGRRRLSHESVERAFHLAWERWPEVAVDPDPASWVRAAGYEYAMSPWHRLRSAHSRPDSLPLEPHHRALLNAVLELPPPYRRTLLLYDGLSLGLPETAAETEASTPAAAKRVLHARAALAERLPELRETAVLHQRLAALTREGPPPQMTPARAVRTGSESRARFWTRAAITTTTLIATATVFTLVTAPTRYEPPFVPGRQVGGVPAHSGPQRLTDEDKQLYRQLLAETVKGPDRLVPQIR
jgi:DNA-directed RNA polymerase specialized sigma24 family protein